MSILLGYNIDSSRICILIDQLLYVGADLLIHPILCGLRCAWRGVKIERNPVLCGLLNGDVCAFIMLNIENKSHILCTFIALLLKFSLIFFLSYVLICFLYIYYHNLFPSLCLVYL
jgi:hypothetical protein